MFYVSSKAGWLSLLICVVAALVTLGISILVQIIVLPLIAMSMVQTSNARRASLLAAIGA
jgi:hypothetical protein